ncbi:MAG: hypothetical protein ACR2MQ_15930 [Gemmatimonadaceae bacterium]
MALVQDYAAETPRLAAEQPNAGLEQQSAEPAQQEAQPAVAQQREEHLEDRPGQRPEAQTDGGDRAGAQTVQPEDEAPISPSDTVRAASQTTPDAWVSEERDSFNWQSAGRLAASAQDERRASEEWSSTDWEPRGNASQDHIVMLLGQVARRVRSGELQIHGTKQMTAEAALAAILAALLAEPD